MNYNPSVKDIDVSTQEGLELLKRKAKYYGHYAENLKVIELIGLIEDLRDSEESLEKFIRYNSRN